MTKPLSNKAKEVDAKGVKPRGTTRTDRLVTIERSPKGRIKKNLLLLGVSTFALAVVGGLLSEGTEDPFFLHGMYLTAGLWLSMFLTLLLSKIE